MICFTASSVSEIYGT